MSSSRQEKEVQHNNQYKLVIGNKNYSSWSLRVWLYMKKSDIDFEEVLIPLYADNYKAKLLKESRAGRVPVLVDRGRDGGMGDGDGSQEPISIWDSMSIIEYLLENHHSSTTGAIIVGWPSNSSNTKAARAVARSICYEMHSGFLGIRDELPQNIRMRNKLNVYTQLSDSCRQQIQRIDEIWNTCITKYASESGNDKSSENDDTDTSPTWLFSKDTITIPDIIFAPVALRFVTYGIVQAEPELLSKESQRFVKMVVNDTHVKQWINDSKLESESLDFIDKLIPASQSPLVL